MKQRDDKPRELNLGMIARGRRGNGWLKVAALSFAVTGCDPFVEAKTSKHTAGLSGEEPPTSDAGFPTADAENPTTDAENPENPENPTADAENPTADAGDPLPYPENPTLDGGYRLP